MSVKFQYIGGSDFPSSIIQLFDAGPIAHVDLVLPGGGLLGAREFADGAPAGGVQIRKPGYKRIDRRIVVEIGTTAEQETLIYRLANGEVGKPYDGGAIAAFAFGRSWRDPAKWFCSELGAWLCEEGKIFPRKLATDLNKVPPEMLYVVQSEVEALLGIRSYPGWEGGA